MPPPNVPPPFGVPAEFPLPRGHVLLVGTGSISVTMLPTWAIALRTWYGCEVRACLTYSAARMVHPDALAVATLGPVYGPGWRLGTGTVAHQDLAEWADLIIVAPATANFVAKCAHGMPDNVALSTVMNAGCPVVIAPSIAARALSRPSVARNLKMLADEGYVVLPTETGISAHGAAASAGAPADFPTILRVAHDEITRG
jgi:phosphopantothenoylcysteine decarboxylase/phosphopantothenate--cysteine ligase